MAVDKRLNPNDEPQTVNDALMIPAKTGETVQLEPGTDDPLVEITEDGGAIVGEQERIIEDTHDANLAEFIDDEDLQNLSSDLMQEYKDDKSSRDEWYDAYCKREGLSAYSFEL